MKQSTLSQIFVAVAVIGVNAALLIGKNVFSKAKPEESDKSPRSPILD